VNNNLMYVAAVAVWYSYFKRVWKRWLSSYV